MFDFLSTHKTSNREAKKIYGNFCKDLGMDTDKVEGAWPKNRTTRLKVTQGPEEIVEPAETNQPEETTEDVRMDKTVKLDEIAQLENTICTPLEETDHLEDTTSTTSEDTPKPEETTEQGETSGLRDTSSRRKLTTSSTRWMKAKSYLSG